MFYMPLIAALKTVLLVSWFLARPILGWFFIVLGLIGMPMPIVNGIIFLMIGIALVGHRNRAIRWSRVKVKLLLKWWASLPHPILRWTGCLAKRSSQQISRQHRRLRWWWMDRRRGKKETITGAAGAKTRH